MRQSIKILLAFLGLFSLAVSHQHAGPGSSHLSASSQHADKHTHWVARDEGPGHYDVRDITEESSFPAFESRGEMETNGIQVRGLSCKACQKRKIRCGGSVGGGKCSNCQRTGQDCVFGPGRRDLEAELKAHSEIKRDGAQVRGLSCQMCQKRKIRCGGSIGGGKCSNCQRTGQDCIFGPGRRDLRAEIKTRASRRGKSKNGLKGKKNFQGSHDGRRHKKQKAESTERGE